MKTNVHNAQVIEDFHIQLLNLVTAAVQLKFRQELTYILHFVRVLNLIYKFIHNFKLACSVAVGIVTMSDDYILLNIDFDY